MNIIDKTGKSNGKLVNGWCLTSGDLTLPLSATSATTFWFSCYFDKDFTFSNIGGKANNILSVLDGVLTYKENNVTILSGEYHSASQSRITLWRESDKVKIYKDYKLILNEEELATFPIDTETPEIEFTGNLYDIRFGKEKQITFITDNYTNETLWLPAQEGYEIDLHDVVGSEIIVSSGNWAKERKYSFYNQFYGFTLTNDVLIPNSFFGLKEKKIIYDDGNTWFEFSNPHFNKKATIWNTEGLPKIYNSNIYLSEFYLENVARNNFYLWNLKELYKKVFDEYIDSSVLMSFYSKRYLGQDDLPVGLNEILFYSRKIYTLEENYLYAYLLNDDREDRKEIYPVPNPLDIDNVSHGDGRLLVLDGDYFLKHENEI